MFGPVEVSEVRFNVGGAKFILSHGRVPAGASVRDGDGVALALQGIYGYALRIENVEGVTYCTGEQEVIDAIYRETEVDVNCNSFRSFIRLIA